ncbi:MFS transporter [Thalassotalea sediminis]|uniref:MFS transporter n=1 Tax=Thalassotalea sediminis TaxID=1759089 RepID=UPI0025723FB6|nr:MFS transporter [Thalassotalea sediminis]
MKINRDSGKAASARDVNAQCGIMLCLAITLFIPTLAMSIINVALPTLAIEFDVPIQRLNWMVTAYLLSIAILVVSAGAMGDQFGKKRVLRYGLGLFLSASVLGAFSTQLWMLIAARLLQGIGAALVLAQLFALAGEIFPSKKTGSVMGLMGAIAALGTALGPVLGGLAIKYANWPSIFWLMLPLGAKALLLCERFIPKDKLVKTDITAFDFHGSLLLGLALTCYALSMSLLGLYTIKFVVLFLLIAFVFLFLFLRSQRNNHSALIRLSLFNNRLRNLTLIASFVVDAIAMSTLIVGPFYLTYVLGLPVAKIGMLMSLGPLMGAISGYPAGWFVDRYGTKITIKLSLLLISVGTLSFAYFPLYYDVYGYIAALVILTPSRQLFHAANNTFVIGSVSLVEKGRASGLINLVRNLGLMTGASVIGGIFSLLLNVEVISKASIEQLKYAYSLTFSLVFFIAITVFFSVLFVNVKPSQ